MSTLVPAAVARLPWRLLFLVMGIATFGCIVLFSAAGGSFTPWAAMQGARFIVFLGMAIVISRLPVSLFKQLAFP
ncbi:MAG TPA: rod shape-determining protein RodA, partial [Rhizorhapis sp.]|nr:rod shape-determining protein RodA [Rhizorhapis sp.]